MLMPLIYMKSVFEVNYSRKLSSLKNRLVVLPSDQELSVARSNTYLYWQWAFESPPNVKLLVRQELGEENTPQASQTHPMSALLIHRWRNLRRKLVSAEMAAWLFQSATASMWIMILPRQHRLTHSDGCRGTSG